VSDTVIWIATPKGFYKGKSETFKGFEFVNQLVAHLPPRRVQLVRRYGVYAGKVRKQWQERRGIYRLAPEGWQKAHLKKDPLEQASLSEDTASTLALDVWTKLHKQSRARLLSNGPSSKNGGQQCLSVLVHPLSWLWHRYNTSKNEMYAE